MSHGTHIYGACQSRMNKSSCFSKCIWLPTMHCCGLRMSHGTRINQSCHPHKWVMAHILMSHGTHIYESGHSHMNESRCIQVYMTANEALLQVFIESWHNINESCHPYKWVIAHICTHINESWHTYLWVRSLTYERIQVYTSVYDCQRSTAADFHWVMAQYKWVVSPV